MLFMWEEGSWRGPGGLRTSVRKITIQPTGTQKDLSDAWSWIWVRFHEQDLQGSNVCTLSQFTFSVQCQVWSTHLWYHRSWGWGRRIKSLRLVWPIVYHLSPLTRHRQNTKKRKRRKERVKDRAHHRKRGQGDKCPQSCSNKHTTQKTKTTLKFLNALRVI